MDTEIQKIEVKKEEKFTPEEDELLSEIEEITRLRTGDVDKIHGIEHTEMAVRLAEYLADKEGADVFVVKVAAWLHDWGRVEERERKDKGDKKSHAEVSRTKGQRLVLQPLLEEGKITEKGYQRILAIIESHSKMPEGKMLEKKIVRDADRLSRFSAIGLQQVVKSAIDVDAKPFYLAGEPILPPKKFFGRKDLRKSVIDDINFVIQWYDILETKAAKRLADRFKLTEVYEEFLRTFAKCKDVVSQETWLKWIASVAENSGRQIDGLKQERKADNKEIGLEEILALEAQDSFSEENFEKFLEDEGLKFNK